MPEEKTTSRWCWSPSLDTTDAVCSSMKFGRYEIVKELGRGTMGVVYQAHDPQIDRMVALKVLRPDRVSSQDFVLRFLKEAKAIGRIAHPNIVTVYDVGQDHGTIYIAMEFIEGRPLNSVIKDGTMVVDDAVALGIQVAEALDFAHGRGIVHRDIKPSNIILTPGNRIKLTDFGIARIDDPDTAQQTQAGDILGTPVYMAPEQVMGRRVDGRTDLYALGVILYEMVAGKRPFGGGNIAAIFHSITHSTPRDPMEAGIVENRDLAAIILKCLSKNPQDRFQTGEAMALALKESVATLPRSISEYDAEGKRQSKGKHRVTLMVALGVCLAIGLLGYGLIQFNTVRIDKHGDAESSRIASTTFSVTSKPLGAQVFVDSAFIGNTPLDIPLSPGTYEFRLNLPGYYEWEAQLQIGQEQPTPLEVTLVSID